MEKKQKEPATASQKIGAAIGLLGFIPWIIVAIQKPQEQALSAWLCWMVICLAITIVRKIDGQSVGVWIAWALGDATVISTTLWSGGHNWDFSHNMPLLIAGMTSLAISLAIGKRRPIPAEIAGCLALAMGHLIIWKFYYQIHPAIPPFLLLAPLAAIISPVLDGLEEWKKSRTLTISTSSALTLGLGLSWFMARCVQF